MSYAHNTLDKFGRRKYSSGTKIKRHCSPGISFKVLSDGSYDLLGKRLTNILPPQESSDVVTKNYIDKKICDLEEKLKLILEGTVDSLTKSLRTYTDFKVLEDLEQRLNGDKKQLQEIFEKNILPRIMEIQNKVMDQQITEYINKNMSRLIAKSNIPYEIDRITNEKIKYYAISKANPTKLIHK